MTASLFALGGPIRPHRDDLTRYAGRSARSFLMQRAASHVTADAARVGEWLAAPTESWVATAGPLVAQNVITLVEWSGEGKPLIPVVTAGFTIKEQVNQKDETYSPPMTVERSDDPVTLGAYTNIARQALDFTDTNADLIFSYLDVGAAAGFDKWLADRLVAAASTGHLDAAAAFDSFDTSGIFTPSVLVASPSYLLGNPAEVSALVASGVRVVADFRMSKPVVLDPLAAVFVASTQIRDTVDEPLVVGLQVGIVRYVSAGLSTAGIAAIG